MHILIPDIDSLNAQAAVRHVARGFLNGERYRVHLVYVRKSVDPHAGYRQLENTVGEYVFTSFRRPGRPYRRILTGFRAALKDAGISDPAVCLHSLRHTALSRMVTAGVDLRTVMDVSGHSRLEELQRYTHSNEHAKADALATFQSVLDTSGTQSARVLKHQPKSRQ